MLLYYTRNCVLWWNANAKLLDSMCMLLQSRELDESLKDQKTWGLYLKGDFEVCIYKTQIEVKG